MRANGTSRREFLGWLSGIGAAAAAGSLMGSGVAAAADSVAVQVLRGVTLVDTGASPVRRDATLVLGEGRILAVGGRDLPVPAGAEVFDLPGKYVIPGLWDMHVHGAFLEKVTLPLCLVHGVVGFREMWGFPQHHDLRRRIEAGEVFGPRLIIGSAIIDGPDSVLPMALIVRTPEEARKAVRDSVAGGADFVKVYPFLDRVLLRAVADECRVLGVRFAGHASDHVPMSESSSLGQRTFEHMYGLPLATSTREAELRRRIAAMPLDPADPFVWFKGVREIEREAALSHSAVKARVLAHQLRRNGSWQSPTMVAMRVFSSPAAEFVGDERMKYMPPFYREYWAGQLARWSPVTELEIRQQREFFDARLRMVAEQHRFGVGTLLGTDTGNPYVFPGFSAHEELELLVRAGLSPMDALRAGTSEVARFLGEAAGAGTLAVGQRADVVVLDGDPLASIANTRRIHLVATRGRVITAADRVRMLAEVEQAALEPPVAGVARVGCC
ncbi:amidohydrolase family protein [Crossiella cryophila]|uniref:Imidazolonepropionase-like amidohydrolase n=1 Tax=Crossiella cryophila TaxID=43355 RepID=A0A7W7CCF2_9PSEU|nr:amidohydrolase family protein [Crossiella cryophila]MBB4677313.1 imidazolonepropionase-like amidohydrolase [Crossiella cryophila]